MKQFIYHLIALFIFTTAVSTAYAQQPPFYNDIQAFKKKDSASFPAKQAILFVGSSSFTKWTDVQDYFPGYPILNRGFGGSSLPDLIRYAEDVIFPYQPKQIVIYCGDNDLAASDTVTVQMVVDRFETLFGMIRKRLGKVPVLYVSIKPSPSRSRLMPKMLETNVRIKQFLSKQRKTAFADVYHKMLNADGTPIKDLFVEDNLHMNKSGYAIWKEVIGPLLIK